MVSERTKQLHKRSSERHGDWLQLKDPFTGERILPDRPPSSLEMQPGLRDGLSYLRNHPEISFRILGDTHGEYDIASPAETKHALIDRDCIFLEGFGATKDHFIHNLFWKVGYENATATVSDNDYISMGAHKHHQLKMLAGCKKPIFFPEVPSGGTKYEQDILELIQLTDALLPHSLHGDESAALDVEINVASTIVLREWYMLAKIGMYMKAVEQSTGDRLRNPLIIIGSAHLETMPVKINGLGLSVESREAQATIKNTPSKPISLEVRRTEPELPVLEAARNGVARLMRHSR